MLTSVESSPPSPAGTRTTHECDFCGRAVHRATQVERVPSGANEPEAVALCVECAVGVD